MTMSMALEMWRCGLWLAVKRMRMKCLQRRRDERISKRAKKVKCLSTHAGSAILTN